MMRSQTDADDDSVSFDVSITTFWAGVGKGNSFDMMCKEPGKGSDAASSLNVGRCQYSIVKSDAIMLRWKTRGSLTRPRQKELEMGKFGNDEAQRKSQGFRWPDRPITRPTPVTLKFSTPPVRIEQSWLIGSFRILPPSSSNSVRSNVVWIHLLFDNTDLVTTAATVSH